MRPHLLAALVLACAPSLSQARPFRAMVTRTAETTSPAAIELGLRYQGFLSGFGLLALPYHQLSLGVRAGLLDGLEINAYGDLMLLGFPGAPGFDAYLGDVPVGLQWTFLDRKVFALGVWGRLTIPVGQASFEELPSSLTDRIPPFLSDASWDAEGLLIAELRPSHAFRLMLNAGYLYNGVRSRGPDPDFDIPDAIGYGVAATFNVTDWLLLGVEVAGRSYLDPRITPAWTDNQHQAEVIPHIRLETVPNLVLEAALGLAVTRDLRDIYLLRALLGLTYEVDLAGSKRGR
ncbi:MAG TPA: hypothetical protein VND93_08305 [Myxococcales bacterium]|jgi:hypothetical protein|nr:hypothetical protein [Myxococcales bacterium]